MDGQSENIVGNLQRIFESFLREDFTTTNNVYLEKLIKHLGAKENAYILQMPFALEWADKCLSILEKDFKKLNPKVTSFMLNLCSLLTLNEWLVIEIRERKFVDRTLKIVERDMPLFTPSMKLSVIRLLSAVSRYSLGIAYLRSAKAWRFLIHYCNQDHTLYVVREARQLLYDLIYIFVVKTNDEQIVLEIFTEIVKPIQENAFDEKTDSILINVEDRALQHRLASTLDLISFIFQQTLESKEKTNLALLCRTHFNLEFNCWKLCEISKSEPFILKICTALTCLNFARLIDEKHSGNGQIAAEDFSGFGVRFFNIMKFSIVRRECKNFLKLAELNHVLWKKLGARAPKEIQVENERVKFENQLTVFQILPILFMLKLKECNDRDPFDAYVMKLFHVSCEQTMRICYTFRDVLYNIEETTPTYLPALAYKSIHGLLSLESVLERDQAVLVFQAMIYALQEFILSSNNSNGNDGVDCMSDTAAMLNTVDCAVVGHSFNSIRQRHPDGSPKCTTLIVETPNVLYAALIGLQRLIQRYHITWTESIETICVVNFALYLLENPNMSARLAVQTIKLIQISIEHYLSPNMALLVDNLNGSALVCLGPMITKRFHDLSWEVRDSTLELTTCIASISRLKFPAFQQFLAEYKIAPIVYQMAQHDSEAYVRASALKCLSKMIAINIIWENDLSKLNIIEHLFSVLYNESEGIVRQEAVVTLIKIYDQRKIPAEYIDTLYSTFTHCVVADLHWEVKVNALNFWDLEIQKQLTNQGMIDGTFPTVTFSKEHKKIVTLTEKEINLRIAKAFNSLAQLGCLGVLLKCLNDDCDLEVIKTAVCIINCLLDKLKKYDYEASLDDTVPMTSFQDITMNNHNHGNYDGPEIEIEEEMKPDVSHDNPETENIIESILSSQDINYLIEACETQMHINDSIIDQPRKIDEKFYKPFANVSPKKFISTIKRADLHRALSNNHEFFLCSQSFSSLLDDILIAVEPNATIFADCY